MRVANSNLSSIDSSGGSGESRETVVARLASDMLDRLPAAYDQFEVLNALRNAGLLNSMVIFLRQEMDRMRKVRHQSRM